LLASLSYDNSLQSSFLNYSIPALDLYTDLIGAGNLKFEELFKQDLNSISGSYSSVGKVAEELFFLKIDGLRCSFLFFL